MGKIFLFFLLFTSLSLFTLSPAYAANAAAAITVDRQSVRININGDGFGIFSLTVGITGREPSLIFSVSAGGCQANTSPLVYTSFQCSVTPGAQTWSASINRRNNFATGTYNVRLSDGARFIINEPFTVGAPGVTPTPQPLTVTLTPPGPFQDNTDSQITISWQPVQAGTNFIVDTTVPAILTLPVQRCTSSPCSVTTTIPTGAPAGTHRVTVTQDGDAANTGGAMFEIQSTTVVRPSPPAPTPAAPTPVAPPPPCARFNASGNCAEIETAIGRIPTDAAGVINFLLKFLLGISGGIAVLLIIFGGYRMMTAQGNPETLQGARETIASAVVGLLFILFSLVLLEVVGADILKIPGFGR